MIVKVKVCGITNDQDAFLAVELGADALGFIFAPSPRQIDPEKARDIITLLPPFVHTVGVFVNEDPITIKKTVQFCGLDLIQLHGDETPDVCGEFMPLTIKAFQLRDKSSLQRIRPYCGMVRAFLLDAYSRDKRGGTGKTFDWDLALAGKEQGVPIILSGGLTPSNIERAILAVTPYAVDVNSGIEDGPGKKSPTLMKRLMDTIKKVEPLHQLERRISLD